MIGARAADARVARVRPRVARHHRDNQANQSNSLESTGLQASFAELLRAVCTPALRSTVNVTGKRINEGEAQPHG